MGRRISECDRCVHTRQEWAVRSILSAAERARHALYYNYVLRLSGQSLLGVCWGEHQRGSRIHPRPRFVRRVRNHWEIKRSGGEGNEREKKNKEREKAKRSEVKRSRRRRGCVGVPFQHDFHCGWRTECQSPTKSSDY